MQIELCERQAVGARHCVPILHAGLDGVEDRPISILEVRQFLGLCFSERTDIKLIGFLDDLEDHDIYLSIEVYKERGVSCETTAL